MEADPKISAWAVREQVERIEQSRHFTDSGRLRELLKHIVEECLSGNVEALKEVSIGKAIYSREPPYDPRLDSTVRVEARRLRRKLKDYYADKRPHDRIYIGLPTGSYIPAFSWLSSEVQLSSPAVVDSDMQIFSDGAAGVVLAIMPFTALSNDPEDQIFADELTDELIYVMEQSDGCRVASRSTTFQYKNKPYSVASVASELGADAVLQGTVRRSGDTIRVTVEMSDPGGLVGWTSRFDSKNENPLLLQERIATTILSRSRFDSSKMRASEHRPKPGAVQANASVYRARQLLDRQTPVALRQALDIFGKVAAAASDYARGYSGMADCYCDLYRLGVMDRETALAEASKAVTRALEIDAGSIEAHCARATVYAWLEWDRVAAEASFNEAIALGGNARCVRLLGVFLTYLGRHGEAERMFQRARAIEPISTQQDCAEVHCDYQSRRFARVVEQAVEDSLTLPEVTFHRALALVFSDRASEAVALAPKLDAEAVDYPLLAFAGAEIRAWAGEPAAARALLSGSPSTGPHFPAATLAMAIGDHRSALSALERALNDRELGAIWIRTDPRFDAVRSTARFDALSAKLDALRLQ